jgi:large subunit ribosomal protein L21
MFAIVKTGGKQYRVAPGDQIVVERIKGEVGSRVSLSQVLALGGNGVPVIGKPLVADAAVSAKIVGQPRGTKVIVFKKKRRKNYRRKRGHRQELTVLKIEAIESGTTTSEPVEPTPSTEPAPSSEPTAIESGPEQTPTA